jgi:hypothetical protein
MSSIRVTKLFAEVLYLGSASPPVHVTRAVVEVLTASITRSPTTPTGAGVTWVGTEALVSGVPRAAISTLQLEVLLLDGTPAPGGGAAPPAAEVHVFGYAG